jgi:hypothetical protein
MALRIVLGMGLLGACATAQSVSAPGAATLGAKGAVVDTIDARNVHDETVGARFEIPPGPHTVEVSLPADPAAKSDEVKVIPVCFSAEAGHSYLTRPVFEENRWRPEIIDEDSGAIVLAKCTAPAEPEPATEPAPAAEGAPEPASPASPPVTVSTTPTSLPLPSVPAKPQATDLPGTGVDVGVGFFWGGESLVDVRFFSNPDRSLSAGRGVQISVGGLWTPLWVEEHVGFGVGAGLGWKYDSIEASNGSVALTRFPFHLSVHSLFLLDRHWFALVGGGLTRELAGHLSGNGFAQEANGDIESSWGLTAQGNLYHRFDRVAVGAGVRYSRLRDHFFGQRIDASSVGLVGSGQYGF